ncbi:L,D-transpeptidase family protein [Desulfoscipio geothermicus]|uniref:Copper amine oxidase N-terminal domain-containing protein n=1 Tax=Desulfoscipio geothermicus DSM 3669 TaxID=1121426 RepID=A0A1I6D1F4_9FIRM|nr:L,D-transpeptidase family protein [Desulfoscipio geothermicus]SFQ99210.1 Copper amine oxidase N-terminal domain-containing protein [Desulfoscipio geothermicus DSM 3669]
MGKRLAVLLLTVLISVTLAGPAFAGVQIVIDKSTNRLQYWKDGILVKSFPIATGRDPSYTPEGLFKIVVKVVNPYYARKNIPGGSQQNPLGCRWLGLSIGGGGIYGIHGTNNPASIGTYASAGCIRMHNRDVIWLYDHTPLGTPVKIIRSHGVPEPRPKPQSVTIVVNGNKIPATIPVAPAGDGTPLLPLRTVFNALGYTLAWDGAASTIQVSKPGVNISIACVTGKVKVGPIEFTAKELTMVNGTTYAPGSLWQKALPSLQVLWNPQQRTVTFTSQPAAG